MAHGQGCVGQQAGDGGGALGGAPRALLGARAYRVSYRRPTAAQGFDSWRKVRGALTPGLGRVHPGPNVA